VDRVFPSHLVEDPIVHAHDHFGCGVKPKKENGIIAKARQVTYYQRHGCYGAADLS
jgi:hypothetical protein